MPEYTSDIDSHSYGGPPSRFRFILLAWEFSGHPCPCSASVVLSVTTHTLLYITTVIYAGILF